MTYSPGPDYSPGPGGQPPSGYGSPHVPAWQPGGPGGPSSGGTGRGPEHDRTRIALIGTLIGVALAVVVGAIMLFRPTGGQVTGTPSVASVSPTAQTTSEPTVTVTVTLPPTTAASAPPTTSPAPTTTSAAPTPSAQLAWPPDGTSLCDDSTAVNQVTSCAFAGVMHNVWVTFGPGTYLVDSPTTGQTYTMSCETAAPGVGRCFGGNNALVYVRS